MLFASECLARTALASIKRRRYVQLHSKCSQFFNSAKTSRKNQSFPSSSAKIDDIAYENQEELSAEQKLQQQYQLKVVGKLQEVISDKQSSQIQEELVKPLSMKNQQEQNSPVAAKFKRRDLSQQQLLQKVEDNRTDTYNSAFTRAENIYIANQAREQRRRLQNERYQKESLKEEKIKIPLQAQEEIEAHIHRQQNMLDELIDAYILGNQFYSKKYKIEEWRNEQIFQSLDFSEDTINGVQYPGSKKGPLPQDDPENFVEWYSRNMTPAYRKLIEELQGIADMKADLEDPPEFLKKLQDDGKDQDEEDDDEEAVIEDSEASLFEKEPQTHVVVTETLFDAVLNADFPELEGMNALREEIADNHTYNFSSTPEEGVLPVVPNFNHMEWNESVPLQDNWSIFRMFPLMQAFAKNFQKILDDFANGQDQQYIIPKPVIPSIYAYFYTLPEQIRDHMIVRNVIRKLEMASYNTSLQQKQKMLNEAAYYTLPFDDCKIFFNI